MENGKNFPPDTIPRIEEEKRETGPPPEAPVPVPLTEAQRRFAAQYHALIYGFLLEKKLEIREYYDKVIAIHGVTPQQIRFETMNSHYCLLAPSSPVAADVPVTVVEQAA